MNDIDCGQYIVWIPHQLDQLATLGGQVDVHVRFPDGRHYAPSLWTPMALEEMLRKAHSTSAIPMEGAYWEPDMIIVLDLSLEGILRTIDQLVSTGTLSRACEALSEDVDVIEGQGNAHP